MKVWIVEKRVTEITSREEAVKCYEGITLDPEANGYDTSPVESHDFRTKEEAMTFLRSKSNYYFYNGRGWGYADEWTCHEESGDSQDAIDYYSTPRSNFNEFEQELNREPGNDH